MRSFEELERVLDEKKLGVTVNCVNNHIETCAEDNADTQGISLMTIRDLLDEKFTDEFLRAHGYVLTIAQFKEDVIKHLALKAEDPIKHNSALKRLHRAYVALKESYIHNKVFNFAVQNELKKHFRDVIMKAYTHGNANGRKIPEALNNRISQLMRLEVESLSAQFLVNTLPADSNNEFSQVIAAELLMDWRAGKLAPAIQAQLLAEKSEINSVKALSKHFQHNALPQEVHEMIMANLISEVSSAIDAGKILPNSPLGAAIRKTREDLLQNSNFSIISDIISKWLNSELALNVAEDLVKHVEKVICNLKPLLEANLTKEFDRISVRVFLSKLQERKFSQKEITEPMQKYALLISEKFLLFTHGTESESLLKCKDNLASAAMHNLHESWLSGKLLENEAAFLLDSTFEVLQDIDEKIQQKMWSNGTSQTVSQLLDENQALRREVMEIRETMAQKDEKLSQNTSELAVLKSAVTDLQAQLQNFMASQQVKNNNNVTPEVAKETGTSASPSFFSFTK